jgi:hypothetical protein
MPGCKVAKHILFPKVSYKNNYRPLSHDVKQFYTSTIHITHNKHYDDHQSTLYYIKQDVVYFHKNTSIRIKSLVPLYNYASGEYLLIKLGENYEIASAISDTKYCVKAPNGNIYVVYVRWHSRNKKALCVYNLTKDKIVHCVTYSTNSLRESMIEEQPYEYSYILANSFVVIYKLMDIGINIYLVDLVAEKVYKFSYAIHDYLKGLLDVVNDDVEKKLIIDMLSSGYLQDLKTKRSALFWDIENIDLIVDNKEEAIPFVKYIKLYFGTSEKVKMLKRASKILSVAFSLEKNELSVEFTTGDGGALERSYNPSSKITIPPNRVLLSKRYNLDGSYDISKSHPYFVYKITSNYIFTNHLVFERTTDKKHEYIINPDISRLYNEHGIYSTNGINILKIQNNTIAEFEEKSIKQGQKLGMHIIGFDDIKKPETITFIDLDKVQAFLKNNTQEQNCRFKPFLDVSNYTFALKVYEKIMQVLGMKKEEFDIIRRDIWYKFYLDSAKSLLYIFIVLALRSSNLVFDCWFVKCNVRNASSPCEVLTKAQIVKFEEVKKYFINLKENDIHLLEIFSKLAYDNVTFNADHSLVHVYNEYFVIMKDYFSILIRDIRQNRKNVLQYINSLPEFSSAHLTCSVYQDNFLICKESIRLDHGSAHSSVFSFYYPLVFVDLKLVKYFHVN